jgi:hypothetical protein
MTTLNVLFHYRGVESMFAYAMPIPRPLGRLLDFGPMAWVGRIPSELEVGRRDYAFPSITASSTYEKRLNGALTSERYIEVASFTGLPSATEG